MPIVPHTFLSRSRIVCDVLQYCYDYDIINMLHVVVDYCYGIRAADPRDPHDLIRSIRVMRWVCTRCAGWPRVDEPEKPYYVVYNIRFCKPIMCCVYGPVSIYRHESFTCSCTTIISIIGIHRIRYCTILRINVLHRKSLYQYLYLRSAKRYNDDSSPFLQFSGELKN